MTNAVKKYQFGSNITITKSPSILLEEANKLNNPNNLQMLSKEKKYSLSPLLVNESNQNLKKLTFVKATPFIKVIGPIPSKIDENSNYDSSFNNSNNNNDSSKIKKKIDCKHLNIENIKPKKSISRKNNNNFLGKYYLDYLENLYKNDEHLNKNIAEDRKSVNILNTKDLKELKAIKLNINNDINKNIEHVINNNDIKSVNNMINNIIQKTPRNGKGRSFVFDQEFEKNIFEGVKVNNLERIKKIHRENKLHLAEIKQKNIEKEHNINNKIKERASISPILIENTESHREKTKRSSKKRLSASEKNNKLDLYTTKTNKNIQEENNKENKNLKYEKTKENECKSSKSGNKIKISWLKKLCCFMGQ